jgi:hypothetical protein
MDKREFESLVLNRRSTLKALNVIRWFVVVAALVAWAGLMALPALGDSGTDLFVPLNLPAPGETELTIGELTPSALPVTGNTGGEVFVPSNLPASGWTELTIGELALSALVETEPGDIWWASNGASDTPGMLPVTGMVPGSHINPSAVFTGERAPETLPMTGTGLGLRINPSAVLERERAPQALPMTGSSIGFDPTLRVPAPWFSTATAIWSDNVISALAGASAVAAVTK